MFNAFAPLSANKIKELMDFLCDGGAILKLFAYYMCLSLSSFFIFKFFFYHFIILLLIGVQLVTAHVGQSSPNAYFLYL